MHSYTSIARSGGPDKSIVVKRLDWVGRMEVGPVYSSIEENVLTFLMRMSATTGGPSESGVNLENCRAP